MSRTFAKSSARTSSPRAGVKGTSSMRSSIRWRLQLWYALVLLAVVGGLAGILYVRVRAARFQEVDGALETAALYLDANLRRFPLHELDGLPPPPDDFPPPRKGPKGREEFGPKGPPPR